MSTTPRPETEAGLRLLDKNVPLGNDHERTCTDCRRVIVEERAEQTVAILAIEAEARALPLLDALDPTAAQQEQAKWRANERADRAEALAGLYAEVAAEGARAAAMHGEPSDRPGRDWLAILAEEFGEVAMEVTKGEVPPVNRPRDEYLTLLRGELVQVASVAMRWLAATDRALSGAFREETGT